MRTAAKVLLGIGIFLMTIVVISLVASLSRVPEQMDRMDELMADCIDENADVMSSVEEARQYCEQVKADAELFG